MGLFYTIRNLIRRPAVLSDITIRRMMEKGLLIETPVEECQIQPNSVDLTLGNTFKIIKPNTFKTNTNDATGDVQHSPVIDTHRDIIYQSGVFQHNNPYNDSDGTFYEGKGYFKIEPGQFVLMASREILNIPNGILSFVQGRSSVARLGIQTEQAGLIDAGWNGTITFEVFNQTEYPILLYEGMRIAQVYFFRADRAKEIYGISKKSKYYGQIEATGSRINNDIN